MALIKLFLQFASVVGGIAATSAVIVSVTNTSSEITETQNNFDSNHHYFYSRLIPTTQTRPLELLSSNLSNNQKPEAPKIAIGDYQCLINYTNVQESNLSQNKNKIVDCKLFSTTIKESNDLEYLKIETDFLKSKASKIEKNTVIKGLQYYMLKINKSTDIKNILGIHFISKVDKQKSVASFSAKDLIFWENGKIKTNKYLTKVIVNKENDLPSKLTCVLTTNGKQNCNFFYNSFITKIEDISYSSLQNLTQTTSTNLTNNAFEVNKILLVDFINEIIDLNNSDTITITNTNSSQTKTLKVLMPFLATTETNNTLSNIIIIE